MSAHRIQRGTALSFLVLSAAMVCTPAHAAEAVVTTRDCGGVNADEVARLLTIELSGDDQERGAIGIRVDLACAEGTVSATIYLAASDPPWVRILRMPLAGPTRNSFLALSISEAITSARFDAATRSLQAVPDAVLPVVNDGARPSSHVYADLGASLLRRGFRTAANHERALELRAGVSRRIYELFGALSVHGADVATAVGDVTMRSVRGGVGLGVRGRIAQGLMVRTAMTVSAMAIGAKGVPTSLSLHAGSASGLGAAMQLSVGCVYRAKRLSWGVDVIGDLVVPSFVARVDTQAPATFSGLAVGGALSLGYDFARF